MQGHYRTINSDMSLAEAKKWLDRCYEENRWLQMQITTEKQRSQLQNNALHLWCRQVAEELNHKGFDVKAVMGYSKRAEIAWTDKAFKEIVWKEIQKAVIGKSSTKRASTADYPKIYDIVNKFLIENFGIYVPWPEKQNHKGVKTL